MDVLEAIMGRHAVREFSEKNIPDEILKKILDAGRFAPSPLNSQPWHFIVVRNKDTIRALVPSALHGHFMSFADVLVVVTVDEKAKVDKWLAEHQQHVYSGACAIQNMWLASWEFGIGGCWTSLDCKTTRKILSIPRDQTLLGGLALGYPKGPLPHHRLDERKPLSEFVYYEVFGGKGP